MQFFTETRIDFMRHRRVFAVSSVVLLIGTWVMVSLGGGLNLGIDFAGGTQLTVKFAQSPSIDELREAMLGTRFVPCDEIPWELFGISMAGYNFLFSLALGVTVLWMLVRLRAGQADVGAPA